MSANLTIDMLDAVKEQALEECMEWAEALIESQLGTDGMAFGDHPLDLGQRIARVQDMARRGVMDVLKGISPQTYDLLVRQYLHDVAESPLMNTGAQ